MCLEKYIKTIKADPVVFSIGLCILLLAVMGTSVRHVSSTMFALLLLLSFSAIRDWRKIYLSLNNPEKLFLLSLFLYTVSGLLSFYNVDDADKFIKLFERYLRFSLIIPVYLLVIKKNKSFLNYLYIGAVISGPFLFAVGLQHYIQNPDVPAKGYYHHIIFGQLAMLNVGIMLVLILTKNIPLKIQLLILFSMICGIATVILSQARGVWLVFPVYILVAVLYALKKKRITATNLAFLLVVMASIAVFTPVGNLIQQRTDTAVSEISQFYNEHQYLSSVGTRLALWGIAVEVWKQHPVLGTGPGDFDDEVMKLKHKGNYRDMVVHNSVHNIYIQALAGSGLIGLLALILVLLIMPLRLFFDSENSDDEGRLAGFIIIVSFAVYGLSESWTLRLSAVSVFLVYIIVVAAHMRMAVSELKNDVVLRSGAE